MDNIIEKSRNINKDFREDILEFYHENQSYFDSFDNINEIETIEEIILIKQKYCEAIENKAHYKEATVVLKHIFILLTKIKNKSQKYESYFETALFYQGLVLTRQERYSQSNHKFKELLIINPLNETYRSWYQSNKNKIFDRRLSLSKSVVLIATVFTTLFGNYVFVHLNFQITIFVFVLLIATYSFPYLYRK